MQRFVQWEGIDEWRAEAAAAELGDDGVAARGVQLGIDPLPYRLDYELDATEGWVTRTLRVEARGATWSRRLLLGRSPDGGWSVEAEGHGGAELGAPGGAGRGARGRARL